MVEDTAVEAQCIHYQYSDTIYTIRYRNNTLTYFAANGSMLPIHVLQCTIESSKTTATINGTLLHTTQCDVHETVIDSDMPYYAQYNLLLNHIYRDIPLDSTDTYLRSYYIWHWLFTQYNIAIDIEQVVQSDDYPTIEHMIAVARSYWSHTNEFDVQQACDNYTHYTLESNDLAHQLQVLYQRAETLPAIQRCINSTVVHISDLIVQQMLVDHIINNDIVNRYPPDTSRCHIFWKTIVQQIEAVNIEVNDQIYHLYHTLTQAMRTHDPNTPAYITEQFIDSTKQPHTITVRSYAGFYHNVALAQTWPAAMCFSDYVLQYSHIFTNHTILSLGAGCGFAEILLYKYTNAKRIIATDIDMDALYNIQHNCSINHINTDINQQSNQDRFRVQWVDWNQFDQSLFNDVTMIVTNDTTYSPDLHVPLANVFHCMLETNRGITAYSIQSIRNRSTFDNYINVFESKQLVHSKISLTDTQQQFSYDKQDIDFCQWKSTASC